MNINQLASHVQMAHWRSTMTLVDGNKKIPINIHGRVIYGAVAHVWEMFHQRMSGGRTIGADMKKIIQTLSLSAHSVCVPAKLIAGRALKDWISLLTVCYRLCFRRKLEVKLSKTTLGLFQGAAEVKYQYQHQTSSHQVCGFSLRLPIAFIDSSAWISFIPQLTQ